MRILYLSTTIGTIKAFLIPHIKMLVDNEHIVDVAGEFNIQIPQKLKNVARNLFNLPLQRTPFSIKNLLALKSLIKIIKENKYDVVHVHTPVASVIGRIACWLTKTKCFYTAHGFHFYKGAPLLNWLLYFPIEWLMSFVTDTLITINKEDYEFAKKNLHARRIEYVPGVGIDVEKFANVKIDRNAKRRELGIPENCKLLLSVGELSKRKNHQIMLRVLAKLNDTNYHYVICGEGDFRNYLQQLAKKLCVDKQFHLLGRRNDIAEILKCADVFLLTSFHEGLPVCVMEAMASGLPCIASDIRGCRDLIENGVNGFLCEINNTNRLVCIINNIFENIELRRKIITNNKKEIYKFSLKEILFHLKGLFENTKSKKVAKKIVMARSNSIDPDSRVEKEANALAKNGYEVTLLGWDRSANYKIREDFKELPNAKVKIIRFGSKAEFGANIKSFKPFMLFQMRLFKWLKFHKNEYDIAHLCDYDTAIVGYYATLGKKVIFDIFDYKSSENKGGVYKVLKLFENHIINKANAIIICSEKRKEQICKTSPKNLTVIHNTPLFVEMKKNNKIKNKIRIAYVGILQDYRLIKEMINVIKENENIELHIGGFGKYEQYVINEAIKHSNIYYYGKLSYQETLELENSCDIMTAIYDPRIMNHIYAAPNKFYEGLMLGKPLIMVKKTGMSEYVEKENLGILIDYNKESFANGLEELINKKNEWEMISIREKELYKKEFSWDKMEERLLEMYRNIA